MPFWDEVVAEVVETSGAGVSLDKMLVDALAARIVLKPLSLDVIVASNLFGDILSDLAAAAAGSIGVAPSGNINPPKDFPSMFEPVHGSAPDIAGQGIANPVGQMWAAAMMLEHLGEAEAGAALVAAFEAALADGVRTSDLGGTAGTDEFTEAVLRALPSLQATRSPMRDQQLFLNGAWVAGVDTFEVRDPYDAVPGRHGSRWPAPSRRLRRSSLRGTRCGPAGRPPSGPTCCCGPAS